MPRKSRATRKRKGKSSSKGSSSKGSEASAASSKSKSSGRAGGRSRTRTRDSDRSIESKSEATGIIDLPMGLSTNPLSAAGIKVKPLIAPRTKKPEIEETDIVDESSDFPDLYFKTYSGETMMPHIQQLCAANLSEPYSVFTFRYFVNNWSDLTYLVYTKEKDKCVGLIVCRLRMNRSTMRNTGYIAMLVVDKSMRRRGLATKLVQMCIDKMKRRGAHDVTLETEIDNYAALSLYESLGFIKSIKFRNYYLNGNDAYRLILHFKPPVFF